MDAKDRHVIGNLFVLKNVEPTVLDVFVGHPRDRGGVRHLANIQQRGQQHADLDGDRQVGKNRERKRDQPRR